MSNSTTTIILSSYPPPSLSLVRGCLILCVILGLSFQFVYSIQTYCVSPRLHLMYMYHIIFFLLLSKVPPPPPLQQLCQIPCPSAQHWKVLLQCLDAPFRHQSGVNDETLLVNQCVNSKQHNIPINTCIIISTFQHVSSHKHIPTCLRVSAMAF